MRSLLLLVAIARLAAQDAITVAMPLLPNGAEVRIIFENGQGAAEVKIAGHTITAHGLLSQAPYGNRDAVISDGDVIVLNDDLSVFFAAPVNPSLVSPLGDRRGETRIYVTLSEGGKSVSKSLYMDKSSDFPLDYQRLVVDLDRMISSYVPLKGFLKGN